MSAALQRPLETYELEARLEADIHELRDSIDGLRTHVDTRADEILEAVRCAFGRSKRVKDVQSSVS